MSKLTVLSLAAAASINATTNSTGVDVSDFTGPGKLVLNAAALTGTTPTLDVKIQHSDTLGGTYTDTGVSFTQVTGAGALFEVKDVAMDQFKPFIRVVSTLGGTTPVSVRSVTLVGIKAL